MTEKRTRMTTTYQRVKKIWKREKVKRAIALSVHRSVVRNFVLLSINQLKNVTSLLFHVTEEEEDDAEGEVEGEVEDEEDDA